MLIPVPLEAPKLRDIMGSTPIAYVNPDYIAVVMPNGHDKCTIQLTGDSEWLYADCSADAIYMACREDSNGLVG